MNDGERTHPDLHGRVAIVTGAGSGIGSAIAERLAGAGAHVCVNWYRAYGEEAADLAARLSLAGPQSIAHQADVSDPEQVAAMVATVVERFGGLHVLVNNAGIERECPILDVPLEDFDRILNVNLRGAFICLQAAGRWMREHGGGSIVNVSSIHEDFPFPLFTPYAVSKGGMRMLMRNAALELAPHRIRVNNVAPGAVATPINQATLQDPAKLGRLHGIIPLERMGKPEEVAAVVHFLASDQSSYVTGSTYYVDGGLVRYMQPL